VLDFELDLKGRRFESGLHPPSCCFELATPFWHVFNSTATSRRCRRMVNWTLNLILGFLYMILLLLPCVNDERLSMSDRKVSVVTDSVSIYTWSDAV
jgi:hypothetical protein